jgi:hypothetical protein
LIDWKQGKQYDGVTGFAGFAISEVTGIPDESEFLGHVDLNSTDVPGGLNELARGINFGDIGSMDQTTYQFRFEVSSMQILARMNGLSMDLHFRLKVESVRFLEFLILQVLEVKLQDHVVIPISVHPTRLVLAEDLVKVLEVSQGSQERTASHMEMH